ncbi:MAG: alpha/beta hydrolase [Muribaculaceae bacterium]|nr:alpha/beta hydrolase [Muribaculaceae bacterium]
MKINAMLIVLAMMCSFVPILAQEPIEAPQQVRAGRLEFFPQFKSQFVEARNVTVWLPDGYVVGEPCDVLYMHDGQMLFDATTTWNKQEWKVDEVMGRLITEDKVRRCIVVGVDNTKNRLNDYFPTKCYEYVPEELRKDVDVSVYKGDEYLRFLVEEVKPFIDNRYKPLTTREHTFVMGSSMGGLISMYALCEYPQVFGGAVCMSTHLSMNFFNPKFNSEAWAKGFRDYVKAKLPAANTRLIYMDRGDVELDGTYGTYQYSMDKMLQGLGWDSDHFESLIFEGHQHMEIYWAQRLNYPLMFILSAKNK